jgi:hypothetical protein
MNYGTFVKYVLGGVQVGFCLKHRYIAHETAIYRNPPIHSFTGNSKKEKLDKSLLEKRVMFLRKYK